MNARLGDEKLPFDSIEGHIAHVIFKRQKGDSVFRRITPIASILVWAGICRHGQGELLLNPFFLTSTTPGERDFLINTATKLTNVQRFLESTTLDSDSKDLKHWYKTASAVKRLLGNFDTDISFIACLMAKQFLITRHVFSVVDVAAKSQSAPGLDFDEVTTDSKRVIAEIKTTIPYQQYDLGAQQKNTFLKDFKKIAENKADFKYFVVTEPDTFEVVKKHYTKYLAGVTLVLLPQALEDDRFVMLFEEKAAGKESFSRQNPLAISETIPDEKTSSTADSIRQFIRDNYVEPARKEGLDQLTICSGEIHKKMKLINRYPLVCSAINGRKIEQLCNINIVKTYGNVGANFHVTYLLV